MEIKLKGSTKTLHFPIQCNGNYRGSPRNEYNAFGCDGYRWCIGLYATKLIVEISVVLRSEWTKYCPLLSVCDLPVTFHWHCLYVWYTVDILKFWTLVTCQKGLDKQCRPRSDCFWGSSLISIFPVSYSVKQFVISSLDSQHLLENRRKKVFKILEHLP